MAKPQGTDNTGGVTTPGTGGSNAVAPFLNIFGLHLPDDSRTYVVALVILTLFLVVVSKWSSNLAVGLALTVLFAVAMANLNQRGTTK